ncbi:hypothetical protein MLD38_035563 [Melastoma candidum]|uniref:Uncharacterized protein n=1 Tax=Melastoma candidum TaxID=119954 RepID=A0ACB9LIR1_9MYRT|nr:hypothetical protein MLD38_035563 [Melastoma candidum]
MSPPSPSLLINLFLLCPVVAANLTFSLSQFNPSPAFPPSDPYLFLSTSSRARALGLKQARRRRTRSGAANSSSFVDTPLFSLSYGGYSITLGFGTPPQPLPLVFDTGSSLVWFPCTSRYLCSRCSFTGVSKVRPFIPHLSSSARIVGCSNQKCGWFFGGNVASQCGHCGTQANCTCPPYIIEYGSGSTGGILLTDTVTFPRGKAEAGILVGCSVSSVRQPAGIAGFGRAKESLPAQLGARRFSYCLQSRKFDDTPVSSKLVLETGPGRSGRKSAGTSYTPFLRNPDKSIPAFQEFYYVLLWKVVVGSKQLKLPYKFLVPGADGNGGTIVDSGTTFTFMEKPIFEIVAKEIEAQMGEHRRSIATEMKTGLWPCFNISRTKKVQFPGLGFRFKGGAEMALPQENYFALVGDTGDICFTVVTNDGTGPESGGGSGPAIILGSFQQQNFYVEYDLENKRLGFRKQNCIKR